MKFRPGELVVVNFNRQWITVRFAGYVSDRKTIGNVLLPSGKELLRKLTEIKLHPHTRIARAVAKRNR